MRVATPSAEGLLVIMGGLPGVGKTSLARALAQRMAAVHVRIDSIEQALRDSGRLSDEVADAGYRVGYALAGDNLRLGLTVIADSVNPIALTRQAWLAVAHAAGTRALEVQVICSDRATHRQRVGARQSDIAGLALPAWADIVAREFEPWKADLTIDTARRSLAESAAELAQLVNDRMHFEYTARPGCR